MTEPKFTDEDLKRFRTEYDQFPVEKIEALVARLEAAEAYISTFELWQSDERTFKYSEDNPFDHKIPKIARDGGVARASYNVMIEHEKAWRQVSGK